MAFIFSLITATVSNICEYPHLGACCSLFRWIGSATALAGDDTSSSSKLVRLSFVVLSWEKAAVDSANNFWIELCPSLSHSSLAVEIEKSKKKVTGWHWLWTGGAPELFQWGWNDHINSHGSTHFQWSSRLSSSSHKIFNYAFLLFYSFKSSQNKYYNICKDVVNVFFIANISWSGYFH